MYIYKHREKSKKNKNGAVWLLFVILNTIDNFSMIYLPRRYPQFQAITLFMPVSDKEYLCNIFVFYLQWVHS